MTRQRRPKQRSMPGRRQFLAATGLVTAGGMLWPRHVFGQCELTTPDILGPFHVDDAPFRTLLASPDEPGTRLFIDGQAFGSDCQTPAPGIVVDVWHATDAGCYSVLEDCPDEDPFNCRGQMLTDPEGRFAFETILPGRYLNGAQYRPRHLHLIVAPPDGPVLTTQIYFAGDPYIDDDRWASDPDAAARIIPLVEQPDGFHGELALHLDVDTVVAAPDDPHGLPTTVALLPCYPNPFNPQTTIRFQLRVGSRVDLAIYRLDGRRERGLVADHRGPGYHSVRWDGRDDRGGASPSGVYLARLTAGAYDASQKLHLIR